MILSSQGNGTELERLLTTHLTSSGGNRLCSSEHVSMSTGNVMQNICLMMSMFSGEQWFKEQVTTGLEHLERIIENQIDQREVTVQSINKAFGSLVRFINLEDDLSLFEFIHKLQTIDDKRESGMVHKFLWVADNVELLDDQYVQN